MSKVVKAHAYSGMNFSWNLNILSGPMTQIQCGECYKIWKERIALMDYPTVECPRCRTINQLNLVFKPIKDDE